MPAVARPSPSQWLHRFICNDDGVKERARLAMASEEYEIIVSAIDSALDAKQVADKSIALANTLNVQLVSESTGLAAGVLRPLLGVGHLGLVEGTAGGLASG